jgi:hypothetical protein
MKCILCAIGFFLLVTVNTAAEGIVSAQYKEDYSKKDLITIIESGSIDSVEETWQISKNKIDSLPMVDIRKTIETSFLLMLIEQCRKFICEKYSDEYWFLGIEIKHIKDEQTRSIKTEYFSNDWVLILDYGSASGDIQKVPCFPNGTIILSSKE